MKMSGTITEKILKEHITEGIPKAGEVKAH